MKLNLGRRIILFIYWLASLVLLALVAFPEYAKQALSFTDAIPADYLQIGLIALLAIYLLLSLSVLCMIFKRNKVNRAERGFITVDSADTGKVRIAVPAIEQMVKQAAYTVDGISDMKIRIDNQDDAIAIQVNVIMVNGSHVPTVTLNMQRAIRQYVEMNCGVAVRSVSISIQAVTSDTAKRSKRNEPKLAVQEPVQLPVKQPVAPVQPIAPVEPEYSVDTESIPPVAEIAEVPEYVEPDIPTEDAVEVMAIEETEEEK